MTTSQGFVTRLPSAGNPLPDQNALFRRGGDKFVVGGKRDGEQWRLAFRQRLRQLPFFGGPDPHRFVFACRGDPLAVPRELRPVDRSLVSAQGEKQLPAASGIDADLAILTGGENALAIARELNTEDRSLMPRQRIHKFVLAQTDHY